MSDHQSSEAERLFQAIERSRRLRAETERLVRQSERMAEVATEALIRIRSSRERSFKTVAELYGNAEFAPPPATDEAPLDGDHRG